MKRLFVGLLIVLCVLIAVGCAYNEEAGVYAPELSGSSLRDTVLYYETDGGFLIPVMKQTAELAGFEVVGRITLRDKETGKEYR